MLLPFARRPKCRECSVLLPSSLPDGCAYGQVKYLVLIETRCLRFRDVFVRNLIGPFRNFVDQSGNRCASPALLNAARR